MVKILEKNTAELVIVVLFTLVLLSSCGANYVMCDAYAINELKKEQTDEKTNN
tara:strand:+ start:134 stop:292 length:159 start_codon:yes stop_codon:yes gene_type:complete